MSGAGTERIRRVVAPLLIGLAALVAWEAVVRLNQIPHYILPGPLLVGRALIEDWGTLWPSLLVTLQVTSNSTVAVSPEEMLIVRGFSPSTWQLSARPARPITWLPAGRSERSRVALAAMGVSAPWSRLIE